MRGGQRILISVLALGLMLALAGGLTLAQEPGTKGELASLAAVGTAFTYQGRLSDGGSPANGAYDFEFKLYDDPAAGSQVGGTVTVEDVTVTDGLFLVGLDFGGDVFTGDARYLEIGVRPGASSGAYTALSPRQELTPSPYALALPGLWTQQNATSPNLIGGYSGNSVTAGAVGATISGGGDSGHINRVTDEYGTLGGGSNNQAGDNAGTPDDARYATVGGGKDNQALAGASTIGGGWENTTSSYGAAVGGGYLNTASGWYATVDGGVHNTASGQWSTVGGGRINQAMADFATIGGGGSDTEGQGNRVTDEWGTVGGGSNNQAGDNAGTTDDARYATVGGGGNNTASAWYTTVAGGYANTASGDAATVAGGDANTANGTRTTVGGGSHNQGTDVYATIAGGTYNSVTGGYAAIGGGSYNTVTDEHGTVGGGSNNQAGDGGGTTGDKPYATVGGGGGNEATGYAATIGGGGGFYTIPPPPTAPGEKGRTVTDEPPTPVPNTASGDWSTVGGGRGNDASGTDATVGGGSENDASGNRATIAGGGYNTSSGYAATVGGGDNNLASGNYASVPGGYNNIAMGNYSFAAGYGAFAQHNGSFVWADSTGSVYLSNADNEFRVRASGGAGFRTSPEWGSGVYLLPGDSSWRSVSDRALKENFTPADGKAILEKLTALPIQEYNLKTQDPSIRHIGPVAQDFYAAFGYAGSDKDIYMEDADGVMLAAIQGLYQLLQEKDAQIAAQQEQIDDLEARLAALEALVVTMAQNQAGGRQ